MICGFRPIRGAADALKASSPKPCDKSVLLVSRRPLPHQRSQSFCKRLPCKLVPDEEGGFVATFPDVRGAVADGRSRAEALAMAESALAAALAGHVYQRWEIPTPSPAVDGQELVAVRPATAAKLALYTAMRQQRITTEELAARLRVTKAAARKLVNPRHCSPIGRSLVIGDREVAHAGQAQRSAP